MSGKEKIKVYADIQKGKTVCICLRSRKRCKKSCEPEVVVRDKYLGWEGTMDRDRFGR